MFEAVAQDVVHVLVQALKTPVAGPHVRVVGGQQPFNSRLQIRQKLPVFPSEENACKLLLQLYLKYTVC